MSDISCKPAGRDWAMGVRDPFRADDDVLGEQGESDEVGDGESVQSPFATPTDAFVEAEETEVDREPVPPLLFPWFPKLKPEEF